MQKSCLFSLLVTVSAHLFVGNIIPGSAFCRESRQAPAIVALNEASKSYANVFVENGRRRRILRIDSLPNMQGKIAVDVCKDGVTIETLVIHTAAYSINLGLHAGRVLTVRPAVPAGVRT